MGVRHHLNTDEQVQNFLALVTQGRLAGKKLCVEFVPEKRSDNQNDMIYGLYRQISGQVEDQSLVDIIRECKLKFGVPILRADSEKFRALYDKVVKPHPYETKLQMMDYLPVTSNFSKAQATEFIDQVIRHYSERGISLIHPSEMM